MGNINIKGSKLGNGTVIIGGNIKNSSIEGNSISIINNKIFVDGKEIETEEKVINGIVEGNNQVKVIKKLLKNFYIVSAVLYFEKSLTLRIIGVPYVKNKENELKVRVSKSNCFTREKIEELRLSLKIQANKDFLKYFVTKTKVITADKKKIDIRQLGLFKNYRENRIQGD
ncbi:hypothetical protein HMPREF1766_02298 [Fusobacterium nucleatum CTI-5]|uniref:hypothetical protein n=1 Tax=Fusobacterium nucleatum TaxID=851 RepID=UPI0003B9278A|nr:hypothetical protein [Fusobacterium nucleatum]ERT31156.1 hypothetical protein HMPREF1766_02298 [Fusobacterium nucleatum CTI-5]